MLDIRSMLANETSILHEHWELKGQVVRNNAASTLTLERKIE